MPSAAHGVPAERVYVDHGLKDTWCPARATLHLAPCGYRTWEPLAE